jgi:hypothetical protein
MSRIQPIAKVIPLEIHLLEADFPEEKKLDTLNNLIEEFNFLRKSISIQSNFDGFIVEDVSIGIGATVKIQHFLGVKPKWRIILRQVGNGVISDIPSGWTDKEISLKNNGAEAVIISVFIARE